MGLHWIVFHLAAPRYRTGLSLLFQHKHCLKFLGFSLFDYLSLPQSPTEFTFHFPHSISSPLHKMLPLQPLDQWNLKVVYLWPATMLAKQPWTHACISSKQSNHILLLQAGSCCMLTTAIQLTGQLGKATRAIINPKKLVRSDQIHWCISLFNCSAYLKNSEGIGVDGSVMDKIYTTVQVTSVTASRPLFKSDQPKLHMVLVHITHCLHISLVDNKWQCRSFIFSKISFFPKRS